MTLVEMRCKAPGCRRLLGEVTSAPEDETGWAGYVRVPVCPRHGAGAGHGDVAAWQGRQARAGKDPGRVVEGAWVAWADLRPAVEAARASGRAAQHLL